MVKYRVVLDDEFYKELVELSQELKFRSLQGFIRAKMKEVAVNEKTKLLKLKELQQYGEKKENGHP